MSDIASDTQVGKSVASQSFHFAANTLTTFEVPLVFNYQGVNASDTAYADVTRACVVNATDTLALSFEVSSKTTGIIGTRYTVIDAQSMACPVTLALIN